MSETGAPVIIAIGGNALAPDNTHADIPAQFSAGDAAAAHIADVVARGQRVVITHGNGPQVGGVLRRVELAAHEVYRLPLDICVADTQGGMGYMLAQCLHNALHARGIAKEVVALVTTVAVRGDDPEFQNPTKPIGGHYYANEAAILKRDYGWRMSEAPGRGWRRVVPSPPPLYILELDSIRRAVATSGVVIAGGGGGVPVARLANGTYRGVEAVVDKDRTAALLAAGVEAGALVLVTNVERVMLDFGKPTARPIARMTADEARKHLTDGQFPPGSMGPKVGAALDFLARSAPRRVRAIICHLEHIDAALRGQTGTEIVSTE